MNLRKTAYEALGVLSNFVFDRPQDKSEALRVLMALRNALNVSEMQELRGVIDFEKAMKK